MVLSNRDVHKGLKANIMVDSGIYANFMENIFNDL